VADVPSLQTGPRLWYAALLWCAAIIYSGKSGPGDFCWTGELRDSGCWGVAEMRLMSGDNVVELNIGKQRIGDKLDSFLSAFYQASPVIWEILEPYLVTPLSQTWIFLTLSSSTSSTMNEDSTFPSPPGASPTTLHEEKVEEGGID